MLPNTDLRGVIAASVTPVDAALRIDAVRLARHCRRLLDDGCAFVSTFGTTGEGASFSTAEKIAALEELHRQGVPMEKQIPAVMTPSVDEAARLLAAVARLGCRAALLLPPFYYAGAAEDGIVGFFEAAVERAGPPATDILLYNIPAFSRVSFTPSLIGKLLARFGGRIAGIKDSTGDADHGIMLARSFPDLSIFTGDDRVLLRLLDAGGAGMIGGMPNAFAKDLRALHDAPRAPGAGELEKKSALRIVAVDSNGSLVAMKAILARVYDDPEFARPMPPLLALTARQQEAVAEVLAATGFVPGQ